MGKQPTGVVIRFATDITKWQNVTPIDANTGSAAVIPTGADLTMQLMFSLGALSDANAIDFTNIATVYVALQSTGSPHNGTIYWQASIANGFINNTCTTAAWNAGTDQQIQIYIPNASNAFNASSGSQTYWLVIYAVTNDATPKQIVFSSSQLSVVDSGMPIGTPSLPVTFKVGTKLSFVCSDGQTRDLTFSKLANGRWSLDVSQAGYNGPGQSPYSFYCSDGMYRDLQIVLQQGVWTLDVGQNGHS